MPKYLSGGEGFMSKTKLATLFVMALTAAWLVPSQPAWAQG